MSLNMARIINAQLPKEIDDKDGRMLSIARAFPDMLWLPTQIASFTSILQSQKIDRYLDPTVRQPLSFLLPFLQIKKLICEKTYYNILNVAHCSDSERPRGYKVQKCLVDGIDQLENPKAQRRLQSGQIIVYTDMWGIIVKVSFLEEDREHSH